MDESQYRTNTQKIIDIAEKQICDRLPQIINTKTKEITENVLANFNKIDKEILNKFKKNLEIQIYNNISKYEKLYRGTTKDILKKMVLEDESDTQTVIPIVTDAHAVPFNESAPSGQQKGGEDNIRGILTKKSNKIGGYTWSSSNKPRSQKYTIRNSKSSYNKTRSSIYKKSNKKTRRSHRSRISLYM